LRLLLDSHAFVWWLEDAPTLSEEAHDAIASPDNDVIVSAASVWELEIKRARGRLRAPRDLPGRIEKEGFESLPITLRHGAAAARLPPNHRDPFDRMLIAQAQLEGLTIVTRDPSFESYSVATLAA
jgi:PIN domain nuclease of toxin-antitoxin system